MTYQIVLFCATEEGPVRSHSVALPNAYETLTLAYKLADRFVEEGGADGAMVVAYGTRNVARLAFPTNPTWDEIPF
jgi:hypothetical protein